MRSTEPAIDRTGWPAGPWDTEPDRLEWRMAEPPGYPCLIVRSVAAGVLCGYVAVPPGHPAHGQSIDAPVLDGIGVHGGLCYADECAGNICHVPRPGESDDVWWLGFDAAHAFDYMPAIAAGLASGSPRLPGTHGDHYRDVAYMRAQVELLAAQLALIAKDGHPPLPHL